MNLYSVNKIILFLFVFLSSFVSASDLPPFSAKNSPIEDYIDWYSDVSGYNVVIGQGVTSNITLSVKDLSLLDLDIFFIRSISSYGYDVLKEGNTIYVELSSKKTDLSDSKVLKKTIPYQLLNVSVTKAKPIFDAFLSNYSSNNPLSTDSSSGFISSYSISIMPHSNVLMVTADQSFHDELSILISEFDIAQKQVFIEAAIIENDLSDSLQYGLNLNSSLGISGFTAISSVSSISSPASSLIYNGGSFSGFLKALSLDSKSKILSKPNLLILDREVGYFTAGKNVPFLVSQTSSDGGNITQSVVRKDVGVSLLVTPHIISDDQIVLSIDQNSSSVTDSIAGSVDIVTNNRTIKTTVKISNGNTITLGGLVSSSEREIINSVPFFGSIPFIGSLFRSTSTENIQTELSVIMKITVLD